MDVIVTDNGFSTDTWSAETTLSISSETDPENLTLPNDIQRVVITFPNSLMGAGLRLLGCYGCAGIAAPSGPKDPSFLTNTQWRSDRDSMKLQFRKPKPCVNLNTIGFFGQIGQPTAINRACKQAARKLIQNPLNML